MTDRRRLATLTAVAVLASGCSGGASPSPSSSTSPSTPSDASRSAGPASASPSVGATTAPTPPPTATKGPTPKKGDCRLLTFDKALAPTAGLDDIACKQAHTAQTYAVGSVDNRVDGHLLAIDSRRVQQQVATTCPRALSGWVGGSLDDLRLSMLRAVWFTPTVKKSDGGADWYRCDVVALAGSDRLTKVRGSLLSILDSPRGRDTYAMCGTARPDDADFARVPCSDPHSWRAFSVITLPDGKYPGREAVTTAGAPCQDAAADEASDPLDYEWGFEGPDADQWAAGQTFIRCWTPD